MQKVKLPNMNAEEVMLLKGRLLFVKRILNGQHQDIYVKVSNKLPGYSLVIQPRIYMVPKKYGAGPKSIQTPVPFHPSAGRNPDWPITMIFMQLTTQLIHYHVLICIIICYKPKGNIIILLSHLEL